MQHSRLIPVLIVFLHGSIMSQLIAQQEDSIQYFKSVDELPTFKGDPNGTLFREYVINEIENSEIKVPDSVSGRIVVLYVIDSTGQADDVRLLDSIQDSFDYEIVRIIKESPKWEPGKYEGRPVRTICTFPVDVNPKLDTIVRQEPSSDMHNRKRKKKNRQ